MRDKWEKRETERERETQKQNPKRENSKRNRKGRKRGESERKSCPLFLPAGCSPFADMEHLNTAPGSEPMIKLSLFSLLYDIQVTPTSLSPRMVRDLRNCVGRFMFIRTNLAKKLINVISVDDHKI